MATNQEVAAWMYEELMRDGELSQTRARAVITERFGRQFVPGGRIARIVLVEWQRLTKGKVVWNAPSMRWRLKLDATHPHSNADLNLSDRRSS